MFFPVVRRAGRAIRNSSRPPIDRSSRPPHPQIEPAAHRRSRRPPAAGPAGASAAHTETVELPPPSRSVSVTGRYRGPVFRSRALLLAALAVCGACTSGATLGSSGTVTLTTISSAATAGRHPVSTGASTSIAPTPVTPNGLLTGTGVDDSTITLGLLIDSDDDRGFSAGVALWQRAVNVSGGVCGRTITTISNAAGESTVTAYPRVAGSSLGLITKSEAVDGAAIDAKVGADQIPALTPDGSSADLTADGPVVIAATEDIRTINALAYLRSTGSLMPGSTLGTLTDSSARAVNALLGARWWAAANGVAVDARTTGTTNASWPGVAAVLVISEAADVAATLQATPAAVRVITDLDGYRSTSAPAGRLLVSLPAPAYGSDNPGAAAVAKAFVATGRTDPGPELMSGYGVAAAWGRLLTQACISRALTHSGVRAAMTTTGPASVDSLFGPSDPALVVRSQLPATRVSSVALADPSAPAGLRPLIWLQAAPGIATYVPPR